MVSCVETAAEKNRCVKETKATRLLVGGTYTLRSRQSWEIKAVWVQHHFFRYFPFHTVTFTAKPPTNIWIWPIKGWKACTFCPQIDSTYKKLFGTFVCHLGFSQECQQSRFFLVSLFMSLSHFSSRRFQWHAIPNNYNWDNHFDENYLSSTLYLNFL